MRSFIQPVKAGWQCGQQAKDNLRVCECQWSFYDKYLNLLLFFIRLT